MKTKFKGITAVFFVFFVGTALIGYTILQRIEKHKRARKIADHVIERLDQKSVLDEFPEAFFPRKKLLFTLDSISNHCDWQKRDGIFVDFSTQKNIGGIDEISFIYEYYLSCDSLRFILSFGLEDEPELMKFNIEQMEVENHYILKPGKQLKYRKR